MEYVVFVILFSAGWLLRAFLEKITKEHVLKDAEFLWFNPSTFCWERIRKGSQVSSSSRILMGIPVEPNALDLNEIIEFQTNKLTN